MAIAQVRIGANPEAAKECAFVRIVPACYDSSADATTKCNNRAVASYRLGRRLSLQSDHSPANRLAASSL